MKLIKSITTTMGILEVNTFTDYNIDDDYVPYAIRYIDINYARFYIDYIITDDYHTIIKGHNYFTVKGERLGIGVIASSDDFSDNYLVTLEVYKF